MKKYKIPAEDIRPIAVGYGMCIVPDTILVSGMPVRSMYRVMPSRRQDSGWRFFAGHETAEYLANPKYNGIYDVNVVANYCPNIIEKLDSPPYSAYELTEDGHWVDVSLSTDWSTMA
ncbi:MAG: DUF2185 domain-containing protein [Clostridia bacterium]|nr:DUF2185 domain-containing protein [Clostridia bacterium]MBQ9993497.1 DUF2185 domain-containing protein [Clostridia bacterium]